MPYQSRDTASQDRVSIPGFATMSPPANSLLPPGKFSSPFPTVVLREDGKHTSVCCCCSSYCHKALKLKIEVRTEFCFSWCYVPPITQACLNARGAKALSANSSRHYCFPGCQHNPGLFLYSEGRGGGEHTTDLSQEIHPALFLPTQPIPKLSLINWQAKEWLVKRQPGRAKPTGSWLPMHKDRAHPHRAADPLGPL